MKLNRYLDDDSWMHISDLMSGLMIVFLLIAISYMFNITQSQKRIKTIVVAYQETQVSLYDNLMKEFKEDLPKWGAKIEKDTLSVTFFEPEILFKAGKSDVTIKFKEILQDFFPRYMNILYSEQFRNNISEIRIEGHTSSEWTNTIPYGSNAYFENMALSQERTLSVLKYCYSIILDNNLKNFLKKYTTANGLSSSKLIFIGSNIEDKEKSRRVEFRVRTNAEQKIVQILEEVK